ncbi:MAG: flagellar FliJ family protein [Mahellales bacterium]|jgi:flagellar FliJ protein
MAFKYKYQRLLDLKISEESSKKLEISQTSNMLREETNKLRKIQDKKHMFMQEYRKLVKGRIDLAYTTDCSYFMRAIMEIQKGQEQVVSSLKTALDGLKNELLNITKEKKKYEKLKEREYQRYLYKCTRIAEKLTDDLLSYRNRVQL